MCIPVEKGIGQPKRAEVFMLRGLRPVLHGADLRVLTCQKIGPRHPPHARPEEGLRVGPGGSGPVFAAFDRLRTLR